MDDVVAPDALPENSPKWEHILLEGHKPLLALRAVMRHLPSEPRCKICANPFEGVGGRLVGLVGFKRSRKNPNVCAKCCDDMPPGGALIDIGVLFVDLRGSTQLGEQLSPAEFTRVISRFYHIATDVLLAHDALIDKLIGDEVMALFIPGVAGREYRRRTCEAAVQLLQDVGRDGATRGQLGFGVGVHAGQAFVGNVGASGIVDFTALGDTVNTAARLQALAQPGELAISEELCRSVTGVMLEGEHRSVDLKGKAEPFAVRIVRP